MFGYNRKHGFYLYDPATNYCGPNYSDGKVQSSVENGISEPLNARDANCQAHDTCYAIANSDNDSLDSCDRTFYNNSKGTGILGEVYGFTVLHANRIIRPKSQNLRKSQIKMAQTQDLVYSASGFKHPTMKGSGGGNLGTLIAEGAAAAAAALWPSETVDNSSAVQNVLDAAGGASESQRRAQKRLEELQTAEASNVARDPPIMVENSNSRAVCPADNLPNPGEGRNTNPRPNENVPQPGRGGRNPPRAGQGYRINRRDFRQNRSNGAVVVSSKYDPNRKHKKKKGFLASLHNIKNKLNRVHLA